MAELNQQRIICIINNRIGMGDELTLVGIKNEARSAAQLCNHLSIMS